MARDPLPEIRKQNPWYIDDQVAASATPHQRRVIENRHAFFLKIIRDRKAAGGHSPLRVLDAGCGDGVLLGLLSGLPELVLYGLDYNPLRAERVRQRVPESTILVADLGVLPFRDACFDLVFASQVLEHIPDDLSVLEQLARVTHRGGWIVLGVPNEGCVMGRLRNYVIQRAILSTTDHVHFYTEQSVEDLIVRAGLSILERLREGFFTPHLGVHSRLTSTQWGYRFLQRLGRVFPSQAAGFYFVCAR